MRREASVLQNVYPEDRSLSMHWMRWIAILLCSTALAGSAPSAGSQAVPAKTGVVQAKSPVQAAPAPAPMLPDSFAGWVASETPKPLADPVKADPANPSALEEYAFASGALGSYKRSGETLTLRALRFHDASGAFGAYSFYRQNGWPKEQIGTGATSNHNRVIFWLGNTLVDANFSHIGPMSGSELRELASQIPVPDGTKALAPPILSNLPHESLEGQTTHYAVGPAGYSGAGVLPTDLVGFDRGAETVTANYSLRSGEATLTIIDYPTPQMAIAQEARIRAYIKAGKQAQPAWPKALTNSDLASLEVRRSGPLVALVSGDAIPDESHKLLALVHFEAELMSVPQSTESEVGKTAKLLVSIIAFCVIGSIAAVLLAIFLGGGRALYRIARGKPVSSVYEEEFISLNLQD